MNLDGWLSNTTGGGGSFTVQSHNGSRMARVNHHSAGENSLSRMFAYLARDEVRFLPPVW